MLTGPAAALAQSDPVVAKALMIAKAKESGLTWAQIAPTIGCASGKEAKAVWKRLARPANTALLLAAARQAEAADD